MRELRENGIYYFCPEFYILNFDMVHLFEWVIEYLP